MILWLDHVIFGSGYGLGAPFWDSRYYWLVDTSRKKRRDAPGELYTFMHGHGAQLHSIQWAHPKSGERRLLAGYRFKPFHSHRCFGRVMVAWSAIDLPDDIDAANEWLRAMEMKLGENTL